MYPSLFPLLSITEKPGLYIKRNIRFWNLGRRRKTCLATWNPRKDIDVSPLGFVCLFLVFCLLYSRFGGEETDNSETLTDADQKSYNKILFSLSKGPGKGHTS